MVKRRKIMFSSISGIASVGLFGVASAKDEGKINTRFNPDRENQVRRFVEKFDDLDDHDRQKDIYSDLTEDQQKAVNEVRKPESLVAEYDVVDRDTGIQSTRRTYEHTVTMRQVTGSVYYRFHHRLTWDSSNGEVTDYDSEGWVTDIAFGYNDGGNNESWFDEHRDSLWVDSFRQREMVYGVDIPGFSLISYYPHSELRGTQSGNRISRGEDDGV